MRHRVYYRAVLAILTAKVVFLAFTGCSRLKPADISLSWTTEKTDSGYRSVFHVVNHGTAALGGNWVIYFGQLPFDFTQDAEAAVEVVQVCSSHYRMQPTADYQPIASGDSTRVELFIKNSVANISFEPEGAYIVVHNVKGKASTPATILLTKRRLIDPATWSADLLYPTGEKVYESNLRFAEGSVSLTFTDIIPSLKSVESLSDSFTFTQEVDLHYDASLSNEAEIVKKRLESLYGSTVSTSAATKIVLVKDESRHFENAEHYLLQAVDGVVTITGPTAHAVFNGIQTLLAMIGPWDLPMQMPAVAISDWPDFAYRGEMIDVARNFTTRENLLRLIDLLASYKLNVLHLHLADDEGWRLEIPGLEELTTVGARRGHTLDEADRLYPAYGSGWNPADPGNCGTGYYTRAEFIEILQYANKNHFTIIPEVDFPGHSRAAIKSMNARWRKYIATNREKAEKYLLTDFEDRSVYRSPQEYTDNVINVGMPSAFRFIEKVINEIIAMYDEANVPLTTFHIGGDEIPHGAWMGSAIATAFMQERGIATAHDLKNYFVQQVYEMLHKKEIQLAGWQEIVLTEQNTAEECFAGRGILSYCWNTFPEWGCEEIPYHLVNNGYEIILNCVPNLYMDLAYTKSDRESGHNWGGYVDTYNSFDLLPFDIYRSLRRTMAGIPVEMIKTLAGRETLRDSARGNIKGVQGQLWSETIRNYGMVEYSLFPKIMGLCERAWNASPHWTSDPAGKPYEEALQHYNTKITERELPRFARQSLAFHVAQPGLKVVDNHLYANSSIRNACIRYTTDGTDPDEHSPMWEKPLPCDAKVVKARVYYGGRKSVVSELYLAE